jgi:hypothetical protein
VGAELAITTSDAPGKPTATTRCRTAGTDNQAGDLFGESLPDGDDEPHGPVADYEVRLPVLGGDQFKPAAGQFFCYSPGQVFPRQPDQVFPFSRLVLG